MPALNDAQKKRQQQHADFNNHADKDLSWWEGRQATQQDALRRYQGIDDWIKWQLKRYRKEQSLSHLRGLLDWLNSEALRQNISPPITFCQCGTEKFIKRSSNSKLMRPLLLLLSLSEGVCNEIDPINIEKYKAAFQPPRLLSHISQATMVYPEWYVYENHHFNELMSWKHFSYASSIVLPEINNAIREVSDTDEETIKINLFRYIQLNFSERNQHDILSTLINHNVNLEFLAKAYRSALYNVSIDNNDYVLTVDETNGNIPKQLSDFRQAAFIMAANPRNKELEQKINLRRFEQLKRVISVLGYKYYEGYRTDKDGKNSKEESLVVLGIDPVSAEVVARMFQQKAFVMMSESSRVVLETIKYLPKS